MRKFVPNHYTIEGIQQPTMDIINAIVRHNTTDPVQAAYLFQILKYFFRFGKKDGLKDINKALDFGHRLADEIKNESL